MTSSGQAWQFIIQFIYIEDRWTPYSQLSTDALHTTAPTARFSTMNIYRRQMGPPSQLSTEALHTITLYIYIEGRWTSLVN